MSDRILRDELLTSERYWAISNDAKLLYIHLILNVDDTARFSGKNFTLRASCFPGQPMDAVHMERMLDELVAQDLIRMYTAENERFVFVPRFKQRLRFIHSRFPEPPNEINDLVIKKSDSSQTQVSPESDSRPPKLSEVKLSEVKTSNEKKRIKRVTPDGVLPQVWNDFLQLRKEKRSAVTDTVMRGIEKEASKAGLSLNDALEHCCVAGWQSFNAEWYANAKSKAVNKQDAEQPWVKQNREWFENATGKTPTFEKDIFDMEPNIQRIAK